MKNIISVGYYSNGFTRAAICAMNYVFFLVILTKYLFWWFLILSTVAYTGFWQGFCFCLTRQEFHKMMGKETYLKLEAYLSQQH
jgi:hypothetical protein